MSDTGTPTSVPGSTSMGPWDFTEFLRRTAGQQTVVKGAGGAYVVIDTSQTRFTMGQVSIEGNQPKTTVKTNDPKLDDPNYAGIGLWSTQFAQTVLSIVFGTATQQTSGIDGISGGDSLLEALQFRQQALRAFAEEEGIEFPEGGGPARGAQGAVGAEGNVTVDISSTATVTNAAFIEWLTDIKKLASQQPIFMAPETLQLLTAMHSSDSETVYTELVNLAKLSTLSITAEQKVVIQAKLQVLAKAIAEKNAVGGSFVLNLTLPVIMVAVFAETLGLSTDPTTSKSTKEALYTALSNIATALGNANYESLIHQKPADLVFLNFISEDPQRVGEALSTLTSGYTLPEGMSASDVNTTLSFIANSITSLKPKDRKVLGSVDREGLTELFSQMVEAAAAAGTISPAVKTELLASLVPLIVDKVFDLNYTALSEGIRSPSVETISNSLVTLTGVDTDKRLSHTARGIAKSYIQALIDMLGFMAQVRAFITMSQGQLSEGLAQAKMASVTDEVDVSLKAYEAQLKKIQTEYKDTCSKIDYANMMRMLMPLLSIFMAVAMLVVSVVSLVSSVLSFGAAAAPSAALIAGLISAIIGVVSSAVSVILTCVDSGMQMAGKESMWVQLANACGISGSAEQSAFIAAFQFLIQLITVIATCGVSFGLTAAKTVTKEVVEEVTEEIAETSATKAAGKEVGAETAKIGAEVAKGVGEAGKTAASAGTKAAVAEVGGTVGDVTEASLKLSVQQLKELGVKAAFKQGLQMSRRAFNEIGRDVMGDIIKRIIFREVVLATVSCVLGSGIVTQGLMELGKLMFHNERDAMIFAIIMTVGTMVVAMAAASKITAKFKFGAIGEIEGTGAKMGAGEAGEGMEEAAEAVGEAGQAGRAAAKGAPKAVSKAPGAGEALEEAAESAPTATAREAGEPVSGQPTAEGAPQAHPSEQAAPSTQAHEGQPAGPPPQPEAQGTPSEPETPPEAQRTAEEAPEEPPETPEGSSAKEEAAAEAETTPQLATAEGGPGGLLAEGGAQGTAQEEAPATLVKPKDAAQVAEQTASKMKHAFEKLLAAFREALKEAKKAAAELDMKETQKAADEGVVSKGGVRALENLAKKLHAFLTTLFHAMKEKSTGALILEAGKETAVAASKKFVEVLRNAIMSCIKKFAEVLKDAIDFKPGKTGSDTFNKFGLKLEGLIQLGAVAIRLWSGVYQYQAKLKEADLHKLKAELAIDTAQFQAVMQEFNQLSGIDQTQTIQDLSDDTSKMFESWTALLEMVSGFIEGAGGQITELMMKANR